MCKFFVHFNIILTFADSKSYIHRITIGLEKPRNSAEVPQEDTSTHSVYSNLAGRVIEERQDVELSTMLHIAPSLNTAASLLLRGKLVNQHSSKVGN